MFIDTHSHLYADEFNSDRAQVLQNSIGADVLKIVLPNIDIESIESLMMVSDQYPDICYPLMGLHPTSVKQNFRQELKTVENWLGKRKFYGIGEIGIDLFWDKTLIDEQKEAFRIQLIMAKAYKLPVVIHVRDSFNEVFEILEKENKGGLKGIFHCFSGTLEQAKKITGIGFYLGIGGVVTFRNSNLPEVLKEVGIHNVVLETDSPYLAPMPYRGKRNENAYLKIIAQKVAEVYSLSLSEVAGLTTANAVEIFQFKNINNTKSSI